MKCDDVKNLFDDLLDGECLAAERNEIEQHLDNCRKCGEEFSLLKTTSMLLKKELPASPSIQLRKNVIAAFQERQKPQKVRGWRAISDEIFIPNPIFAAAILIVCALTGAAFWLGRVTVSPSEIAVSNINEPAKNSTSEVSPAMKEMVKYVEVPVIKYVQFPIEKEKIVTRIVYRTARNSGGSEQIQLAKNQTNSFDLNDFQPIAEMNPKILKKGETDEK